MTMAYWIGQFLLTGIWYLFVLFLWPSVVFRRVLAGKSRTFRFGFCVCGMILLVNLAVLLVGLIPHALTRPLVAVVFYGVLAVSVWRQSGRQRRAAASAILRMLNGSLKGKSLLILVFDAIGRGFSSVKRRVQVFFRGHRVEYTLLILLSAYAVLYFSWGAFQLRTYGSSDMYVHHAWIDGLLNGKIFSAGIYPEGMHTFLYVLNCISGIRVYSLLLFTAGIHSAVLMVSVWLFLREIFHWKYFAHLAVLLFLILEQNSFVDLYALSRIQWTIPQEFALYTEFLCGAYLIRWLRGRGEEKDNRLLFGFAVAASFCTHFYVTIMAVILCLGVLLAFLPAFFRKGCWRRVLLTAVIAILIPVVPMAGAFAEGHPLQGSLTWALGIMRGTQEDTGTQTADSEETLPESTVSGMSSSEETLPAVSGEPSEAIEEQSAVTEAKSGPYPVACAHILMAGTAGRLFSGALRALYEGGCSIVYGPRKGRFYEAVVCGVLLISLLGSGISAVVRISRRQSGQNVMAGALAVSASSFLFLLDYAATAFQLPQIIAGPRVLTSAKIVILASCLVIPDLLLWGAGRGLRVCVRSFAGARKQETQDSGEVNRTEKKEHRFRLATELFGIVLMAAVFTAVVRVGEYHGYLYYAQTRYPEAAETANRIISEMKPYTYTLVSTTDELYQINRYGYHEELLTLVKSAESSPGYSIPTGTVFLFIEKKPLMYVQTHVFRGPEALAENGKTGRLLKELNITYSEGSDVVSGTASASRAGRILPYSIGDSHAAMDFDGRVTLESKAMRWMETFRKDYPYDADVYFENDRFICYEIRQDPQIPYKLGFFADK